jgi:hypothetical protein
MSLRQGVGQSSIANRAESTPAMDIPKNMLSDPSSIRTEKKSGYVNTSLPQYQDIDAALKIIDEALARAGKR